MRFFTGIDGRGKTFIILGALLDSEKQEVFTWVFDAMRDICGADACDAVHVVASDEDCAAKAAMLKKVHPLCWVCLPLTFRFM